MDGWNPTLDLAGIIAYHLYWVNQHHCFQHLLRSRHSRISYVKPNHYVKHDHYGLVIKDRLLM